VEHRLRVEHSKLVVLRTERPLASFQPALWSFACYADDLTLPILNKSESNNTEYNANNK